jgi:hypothetical protein
MLVLSLALLHFDIVKALRVWQRVLQRPVAMVVMAPAVVLVPRAMLLVHGMPF